MPTVLPNDTEPNVNTHLAYASVVVIWSTTPLAIHWSSLGGGPLFGLFIRMFIGAIIAALVIHLFGRQLPRHRAALLTYCAGGIPLYGAMTSVYLSAQLIPSGWIAIVFGLTPVITGLFAQVWLGEKAFTGLKSLGMALAFSGLLTIFANGLAVSESAILGILGVLFSATVHSLSAVWIKRLDAGVDGLAVTVGSLWIALPLFAATWFIFGQSAPASLPDKAVASILYLGVVGSVLGFSLYYFVLTHMEASRVALITLITPAGGLWIGHSFNQEPLTQSIVIGTGLIIAGLGVYDVLPKLLKRSRHKHHA